MYNLDELTEFNPALIYAFEPESSPERLSGQETFQAALFPEAGQHEDMFDAYLFAQKTILPFIREQGLAKLDENLFLEWINTLHGFIGKTLLASHQRKSGEYTKESVLRWHKGAEMGTHVILHMASVHPYYKSKSSFIKYLKEQGVAPQDATIFIELLGRLKNDEKLQPHPSQIPFIDYDKPSTPGAITLHKLSVAYHSGMLSTEEKAAVDHIVKICIFPSEIPAAMQKFAATTLPKLRALDKTDLPQVANFLGDLFYEFTDIHPFGNANGRTGTCLVNIALRALDLPSILLRHPGEKTDEKSDYSKAIDQLDSTRDPLKALILKRIVTAQEITFSDESLKKVIHYRVALSTLLQRIQKKHPQFDIESLRTKISPLVLMALQLEEDPNKSSCLLLADIIDIARKEEIRLDEAKLKPLLPLPVSAQQKEAVAKNLEKLTGQPGWKINATNGLIAWIELPGQPDTAKELFSFLESTKVATVSSMKRADNDTPVVRCTNIDVAKLHELTSRMSADYSSPQHT